MNGNFLGLAAAAFRQQLFGCLWGTAPPYGRGRLLRRRPQPPQPFSGSTYIWPNQPFATMHRIAQLINTLHLQPHPEGGFYTETYRSATIVPTPNGPRPAYTAIYFLLTAGNFSAFHRIASDEAWHHYEGDAVHIHIIHSEGDYQLLRLGKSADEGEVQQAMVPAGAWFASECTGPLGYALVGCTVAPGFVFDDFELATAANLQQLFPAHSAVIQRLTHQ